MSASRATKSAAPPPERTDEAAPRRRFSVHFWVALCSAVFVLGIAVVDLQGTSPGPLATVHGRIPELAGRGGCAECHGGWTETMADACTECHEDVGTHIDERHGLHGFLDPVQATACSLCHGEHHGSGFELVNTQSFVMAVATAPEDFDHEVIGFPLRGKHTELSCAECHEHADAEVLPEGARRFMGLNRDCASCHDDPHEGAMPANCASCHVQTTFEKIRFVQHEKRLHLAGGHADASCRDCHTEDSDHALEAYPGPGARAQGLRARGAPDARNCRSCHETPHTTPFLRGVASLRESTIDGACIDCHAAEHATFREPSLEVTAREHRFVGFPLDEPHTAVECAECHEPGDHSFEERYPGRGRDACAACHADPHGGQFDRGPFAERGCISCHARQHFEPHAFTVEKHARADLALTGAHLDTDCHDCHVRDEPEAARTFRGTEDACAACHEDLHHGFFETVPAAQRDIAHGTCAHCHEPSSFAEVEREVFDHGKWTGFPVLGAHAQEDCEACHVPGSSTDRALGRVADHFGDFEGCETCHADPHDGEFAAPPTPKRGAKRRTALAHAAETVDTVDTGDTVDAGEREGCAQCHRQTSFRAIRGDFDHALWTGFPLEGSHANVDCSSCHHPRAGRASDRFDGGSTVSRTTNPVLGNRCNDCHTDPHARQFAVAGATDCARCHAPTSFHDLVFDHDFDTDFRLGPSHRGLECGACHQTWSQGEVEIVRYTGLGKECGDCHEVHRNDLSRLRGDR